MTKVTYKPDTKLENAGTFTIMQEDHTIGNMVRVQLHTDKSIVFAGYRIPHPLEAKMVIKIQTNGTKKPEEALQDALDALRTEWTTVQRKFMAEFDRARNDPSAMT